MLPTFLTSSLALLLLSGVNASDDSCRIRAVPRGPDGDGFYTPPELPANEDHGALIWFRPYAGPAALSGGKNTLLLYTQEGIHGDTVATSGYMVVPNGDAPEGGWPVVTWAHGTTGIADQCAPTRYNNPGDETTNDVLLADWINKGYAVVRTDYEGLGTPGDHPYLIGNSEGRAVLDIIRAARAYQPKLSNKVVIAGHSQGGQAALFAASLAPTYTPELELFGTIAFAPVSNLENEVPLLRGLSVNALSGTVALILRGLSIANSSLDATSLLTPTALALYPETLTECSTELSSDSSFGSVPANNLLLSSANVDGLLAGLKDNDASFVKIQKPVLVLQGEADTTVLPFTTTAMIASLKANGVDITELTYDNATHTGVIAAGESDATVFLEKILPTK